jgi:hypothetical protein
VDAPHPAHARRLDDKDMQRIETSRHGTEHLQFCGDKRQRHRRVDADSEPCRAGRSHSERSGRSGNGEYDDSPADH